MTHILHNGVNGGDSLENANSENGDSTSSELERLENASPCPSGSNSPTERGIAKTKKQEDMILSKIEEAAKLRTNTLDLSNKGIRQFPSELLDMPQLEYLYLEGNELTTVPDELLDKLPNLKWLDLRRNYLIRLPSVYTGRHSNLRNLLLEGNSLRTLPLELGLIKSLHGLNISNNPLEFPPPSIIEKGTSEVLKFLREVITAKSAGKLLNGGKLRRAHSLAASRSAPLKELPELRAVTAKQAKSAGRCTTALRRDSASSLKAHSAKLASQQFPPDSATRADVENDMVEIQEDLEEESSSSDDNWEDDGGGDLRAYAMRQLQQRSLSTEAAKKAEEEIRPINMSAELHRPVSYTEIKQSRDEKVKRAGASGKVGSRTTSGNRTLSTATSVRNWKVNPYPEPPSSDFIDIKAREERKLAKERELKERTDAILQRRKNEDMLKDWRDETKRLKQKKYYESMTKGTKDYDDAVYKAPFDVDKDYIKIQTNAERIKADVKTAHEKIRGSLSPGAKQRIEEEKAQRILQLEKRIKQHSTQMHDRRKQPKGSPQEEMEAARRELEVAEALHRELMSKRKEMEYRFRAFVPSISSITAKSLKQHKG